MRPALYFCYQIRYSSYLLPFPQLQSSQSAAGCPSKAFPACDGLDVVDVELHAVLPATSALDAPEAVTTQHVIAHRA